ncbi:MAG TPA: serine hydrolase domain-containing protein [Marmoricola sp.]|nr:serine hydrolase domain-containing protein [Marmoricola sp.]
MALVTDLTARRLEAVLAEEQRQGRVPSVVAALTRDGSLVWRGSRGDATGVAGTRPPELQYRIGSITKTMTAVVVLRLRDEGRLGLNDPVTAYLPEVGRDDLAVRTLLAHSSALAAEPEGEWWERVEGGSFGDLLTRVGTAALEPGATYHYSNLAYGLLGEIVARVDGRSWWESVSARLLGPLGMLRTGYDPSDPHAQGWSVAPYSPMLVAEPAADTRAMAPAGQVWSTALDLATYAGFLVAGHPDVLARSTLEEMATPQSGTAADGMAHGYGLGLRLVPGGSGTLVGHTGSMPGFQAALLVDRPRRTGAVVLANSTTGLRPELVARRLLEVLEKCEPTLDPPWTPVGSVPADVEEVLGVWHWGNTAQLITWDGEALHLENLGAGARSSSFGRIGSAFVGTSGYHHGEELTVVRRPDGTVSHLVVSTFVLTRAPYDPEAPIPGGVPVTGPG